MLVLHSTMNFIFTRKANATARLSFYTQAISLQGQFARAACWQQRSLALMHARIIREAAFLRIIALLARVVGEYPPTTA